jgi:hypothetical protein
VVVWVVVGVTVALGACLVEEVVVCRVDVEAGVAVVESSSSSSSQSSSSDPSSGVDWAAAEVETPELPEEDPKDQVTSTEISQYMESDG